MHLGRGWSLLRAKGIDRWVNAEAALAVATLDDTLFRDGEREDMVVEVEALVMIRLDYLLEQARSQLPEEEEE
ncbi:hypothetical protein OPV22_010102 [Ensete ventricosum]|uniref:Uncharacterized protein n=1 Tax=Ensete ventricosum TaxID=4639 RepID=A0AAV8Q1J1_ENSVE|nr:hypothetical protein OPV22_010102 [Ensete ventricosum]